MMLSLLSSLSFYALAAATSFSLSMNIVSYRRAGEPTFSAVSTFSADRPILISRIFSGPLKICVRPK